MQSSTKSSLPPLLILVVGILAVSTASLFIRFAQQEAPSIVIAASRLSLATLILAPAALTRRTEEIKKLSRNQFGLLILSGVFLAFHFASWITSLELTSVTSSVVLVTTTPLWVALLSPIFLKERITRTIWVGLILALTGGIIVGLSDACQVSSSGLSCSESILLLKGTAMQGNILALVGALLGASYLVIGRKVRTSLSLLTYTFLVYGVAAVVLLLLTALQGRSLVGYSPQTYIFFAALAIFPQLLGHSSFNWALKFLPAAYVSVALLGEPVGSVILAMIFLRESPTVLEFIGGLIILFGIYWTTRTQK